MKKINYILFCFTIAILMGCSDWLNIEPENEATDEKIFKDYVGFRNSLNGIYDLLSQQSLYGKELSWGFLSALAQTYMDNDIESSYPEINEYNYNNTTSKNIISSIWTKSYNAIANCNKLIEEIEKKDSTFFPYGSMEKNMILGEALALRGFIHFDLLRLFAPAPITGDDAAYIPFYDTFPSKYEPRKKTSEIIKLVTDDLLRAKDLLAEQDTINSVYSMSSASARFGIAPSGVPSERFFGYRGLRMNYFAIAGMLARVYHYNNQKEEAKKYAYQIYDFVQRRYWYSFTNGYYFSCQNDWKYNKAYDDIIFGLYDNTLPEKVVLSQSGQNARFLLKGINEMYNDDNRNDGDDYRKDLIIQTASGSGFITQKWLDLGGTDPYYAVQYYIIPILRYSEIIHILSESSWDEVSSNTDYAMSMLNYIRSQRGAKRPVEDPSKYKMELIWEGMKEYHTEGQTFFMFKRMNNPIISGTQSITLGNKFVLPIPENEEIF